MVRGGCGGVGVSVLFSSEGGVSVLTGVLFSVFGFLGVVDAELLTEVLLLVPAAAVLFFLFSGEELAVVGLAGG